MTAAGSFRVALLACLLAAAGCDDGSAPGGEGDTTLPDAAADLGRDRGPPADMRPPDPDMAPADMRPPDPDRGSDMAPADMAPPDPDLGPDMALDPDMGPDPDAGPDPDMAPPEPDMSPPEPDMAPPVEGLGLVAGAAHLRTDRYRLTLTVAGPSPAATAASPRYRARLGVGALTVTPPAAP